MKSSFAIFLAISAFLAFSQEQPCEMSVTGKVLDIDTNQPLPFATIKIVDSSKGAIADQNGDFTIEDICEEEIHLEVRFVGYKTFIHHHDFHHGSPVIFLASDDGLLESIIVEGTRTEELKSLSVSKKELSQLTTVSASLGDLAEEMTGVSLLKTGTNISKPMIHGLHSNRVLVVNDGVRHAYQVWGQEHAPEIDPSHVDQIEIVKGAGTVKYGPEALGGVILYNSKKPEFDKDINGSASTSFQSNGRAVSSQFSVGKGSHRFAWSAGAFGVYQGDLRAPDYNLSNTGKREFGASFNSLLHKPKYDLQVSGNYFNQTLGILRASIVGNLTDLQNGIDNGIPSPTFPATYGIQNPKQETEHGLIKTDLSLFRGEHAFNFVYAFQVNRRKEFDVRRGEFNDRPVINLRLFSHTVEGEWLQPVKGRWSGNSGIQLFTQRSTNVPGTNNVNFIPDYDVVNLGAFTIQSLEYDKTVLELGARIDYQSISASDVIRQTFSFSNNVSYFNSTFTLGFRNQVNENFSVFTNIGSAWRPPNVAELYSFGYHHSRVQYGLWRYDLEPEISTPEDSVFNQNLRPVPPENGIKWVTGFEVKKRKLNAEFIFYANQINNYIFLRPYGVTTGIAGTFPFFIYDQTDAVFMGSDWDIRFNHSQFFTSELKVSYVYATDREEQQALLDVPPLNINYALDFEKGNWGYGLTLDYTARQWNAPPVTNPIEFQEGSAEIDRNQIFDFMLPPNDYLLLGGKVTYQKNQWSTAFNVHNLLNTSYRIYTDRLRYFADAPGRNFSFALEYTF